MKSNIFLTAVLALTGVSLLGSCSDNPSSGTEIEDNTKANYGIWVAVKTDKEFNYLLTVEDLMEQTSISPLKKGFDTEGHIDGTYGTVNKGFYYSSQDNKISKFAVSNNRLTEVDNCIYADGDYSSLMMKVYWNQYLNIISWTGVYNEVEKVNEKKLIKIDAETMTIQSKLPFKFPIPENLILNPDVENTYIESKDISISPTWFEIRGNKAFVGYAYWDWGHMIHADNAQVLVCDYPSMENTKVIEHKGNGVMSGTWWMSKSSFRDSRGDIYFTTVDEENNYTLLRIKDKETDIDTSYSFDLSGNNIYVEGFGGQYDHHTYIKDGYALLGSVIVNIWSQKVLVDLDTLGYGEVQSAYSGGILVENGLLYIVMKTKDARWFVCEYNIDTNKLTKGIEIDGGVTSVNRIDKLN